jgi:hypothetical protein
MINTNDTTISAFARLLATENIVVRHSNDAHTASFDMVERILTLPRWKGMTPALYDMLVGHEVAHALWTDATIDKETGNLAACVDIAPDNPKAILPILNIVEDARIERLIKSKYPGLKRDFVSGYKTIHEMGIFELEGRPVDKMSFLDRLNMEFKLGILGYLNVPFRDSTEIWFRDRIAASQTWDDVVEITRDLYEYDKQKQEEEEEEDNRTDLNQQVSGLPSGAVEVDDDSKEGSSRSNATDGEGDGPTESDASPGDGDDDSDGSATSKGAAASEYTPDVSTQDAMNDAMVAEKSEWMPRDKGIERMPTPILKKMIVSPERIRELHVNGKYPYSGSGEAEKDSRLKIIAQHFAKCDEYMLNEKSSVNYLSKQFEMRKAADIHKRTMTSKTGRLDPVRMINYRWSEDIFAKNQTVRDGKNHGFVCVLDWSGSMCNNLLATVRQAITLAMFCRRTGLPFELYAFSDRLTWNPDTGDVTTPETWSQENYTVSTPSDGCKPWKTSKMNELQMLNFLSAKMNTREFTEACRVLYSVAMCEGNCKESRGYATWTSSELGLGGTPLDETLVALHTMLPAFQRKHGVQVLNAVILTDGDGRNTFDNAIIINPITKRSYGSHPTEAGLKSTYLLLKSLKETTGCNLIGMYLSTSNKCINVSAGWFDRWEATHEEVKSVQNQWKQSNYYVATGKYADFFDEAYVINANTNPEIEINLPDSATQANLRNAFVKGMKSRGMSRNLSNRFIEVVAR